MDTHQVRQSTAIDRVLPELIESLNRSSAGYVHPDLRPKCLGPIVEQLDLILAAPTEDFARVSQSALSLASEEQIGELKDAIQLTRMACDPLLAVDKLIARLGRDEGNPMVCSAVNDRARLENTLRIGLCRILNATLP